MTVSSFTDDLVHELHQVAGGRCGRVLLAPNTQEQFAAVTWTLSALQSDDFMQDAAQVAFNNTERYIATTQLPNSTSQLSGVLPEGPDGLDLLNVSSLVTHTLVEPSAPLSFTLLSKLSHSQGEWDWDSFESRTPSKLEAMQEEQHMTSAQYD
ncbi:unnamed protein product [Phytophthora lilii]|uniref:Unnamed protein product n=1 Tax=Phytophthora lilii TaxID=2077276 RepID=A0A9W6XHE9_9STRA|nr:unnamed protein product [Phytophthora lilii]